jgi:hypothetical protein
VSSPRPGSLTRVGNSPLTDPTDADIACARSSDSYAQVLQSAPTAAVFATMVRRPSWVEVWMNALAAASRVKRRHSMRGRIGPSNCWTVRTGP